LSIQLIQHVGREQAGWTRSPTKTLGSCAIMQLVNGWMQQHSLFSFGLFVDVFVYRTKQITLLTDIQNLYQTCIDQRPGASG